MVIALVTILHVIVCIILILVVLLQSGKSADLAGAFGGASTQTAFGSRGPASFLSKLTSVAAVLFMGTCVTLTIIGIRAEKGSILDSTKEAPKPVSSPAVQPQAPAPTPDQIKKMQEEIESKQKQAPGATVLPIPAETAPAGKAGDTKPVPGKPPDPKKKQ